MKLRVRTAESSVLVGDGSQITDLPPVPCSQSGALTGEGSENCGVQSAPGSVATQ